MSDLPTTKAMFTIFSLYTSSSGLSLRYYCVFRFALSQIKIARWYPDSRSGSRDPDAILLCVSLKWSNDFKWFLGLRLITNNKKHVGPLIQEVAVETLMMQYWGGKIRKIHIIIFDDRKVQLYYLANIVNISYTALAVFHHKYMSFDNFWLEIGTFWSCLHVFCRYL